MNIKLFNFQFQVLSFRELAAVAPMQFQSNMSSFFDTIFIAIKDPKLQIREHSKEALRQALYVLVDRERSVHDPKEKDKKEKENQTTENYYKICYQEAVKTFDEANKERALKDERIHGSLLIINELLRYSNEKGEQMRSEVEEFSNQDAIVTSMMTQSQVSRHFHLRTKIMRLINHPEKKQNNFPCYALRDLKSLVKYHTESGVAPGRDMKKR